MTHIVHRLTPLHIYMVLMTLMGTIFIPMLPVAGNGVGSRTGTSSLSSETLILERVTLGGIKNVAVVGENIVAIAQTSVGLLRWSEGGGVEVVDYYDLEPLVPGEYLTAHYTMGNGGLFCIGTNAGFIVLRIAHRSITPVFHYAWESKSLDEIIRSMALIDDRYLILACGDTGLFVFDIGDKNSVREVDAFSTPTSSFEDLCVRNGQIYVADGINGLRIFTLDDRGMLHENGIVHVHGWSMSVEVMWNLTVLSTYDGRIFLWPSNSLTSDPAHSEPIRILNWSLRIYDAQEYKGYYYLACGEVGIMALTEEQILSGSMGHLMGPITTVIGGGLESESGPSRFMNIVAYGEYLVSTDCSEGIIIFKPQHDTANDGLSAIKIIADPGYRYHDIYIWDDTALVGLEDGGMLIYGLKNRSVSVIKGHAIYDIDYSGDNIYAASDGVLYRVNKETFALERPVRCGSSPIYHLASTSGGFYFINGTSDLYYVNLTSHNVSVVLRCHENATIFDFDISPPYIALATSKGMYLYSNFNQTDHQTAGYKLQYHLTATWCLDVDINDGVIALVTPDTVAYGDVERLNGTGDLESGGLIRTAIPQGANIVALTSGRIYVGCDNGVMIIAEHNITAYINTSSPVISLNEKGDTMLIGTSSGGMYALIYSSEGHIYNRGDSDITIILIIAGITVTLAILFGPHILRHGRNGRCGD